MAKQENSTDRNPALDFTKGTLVLFMVLYHWVNYFVSTQGTFYTYLRFITPSFIFIAGFLIGNVYPAKYGWGNPEAAQRLIIRGLKLLAMFTILNVAANLIFASNYNGTMPGIMGFLHNAGSIYLSGNGRASFLVLVPISYLLLLSAGILLAGELTKYLMHLLCAGFFLCLLFMNLYGRTSANLEMVSIGLVGMIFGLYSMEQINLFLRHSYVLVSLNLVYIFAITIWGVVYVLQVAGVCLSVMLIYWIGVKGLIWRRISCQIKLLGKYSLFGYVSQIGILQLLHRALSPDQLGTSVLWIISFTGAFALTIMLVNMLNWSRSKSEIVDRSYSLTFS